MTDRPGDRLRRLVRADDDERQVVCDPRERGGLGPRFGLEGRESLFDPLVVDRCDRGRIPSGPRTNARRHGVTVDNLDRGQ